MRGLLNPRLAGAAALAMLLAGCARSDPATPTHATPADAATPSRTPTVTSRTAAAAGSATPPHPLSEAARRQIGVTVAYDAAYARIPYPLGDVDASRGVCTDVVVRALRTQGIDLQQAIHDDRRAHPEAYPARWRHAAADTNIDHRRVPNQMAWFARAGWSVPVSRDARDYRAGDIVAWDLGRGLLHVGIVSNRRSVDGTPLILHNIARGTREEPLLFAHRIIGHYRVPDAPSGRSRA